MSAAEADVADDAFFEDAVAAANLTLKEGEVVAGYQCYENGSILVPLADGGNQTVHSPDDVNANIHKVRQNELLPIHGRRRETGNKLPGGAGAIFQVPKLGSKKSGDSVRVLTEEKASSYPRNIHSISPVLPGSSLAQHLQCGTEQHGLKLGLNLARLG